MHLPLWVKVHPQRDGGWATVLAHELHSNAGAPDMTA
jgi:hypothetical protein